MSRSLIFRFGFFGKTHFIAVVCPSIRGHYVSLSSCAGQVDRGFRFHQPYPATIKLLSAFHLLVSVAIGGP